MVELTVAGITLLVLYKLLIEGYLWKAIFLVAGFFCIYEYLSKHVPITNHICFTILEYGVSWAFCLPAALVLLVLGTSREKE